MQDVKQKRRLLEIFTNENVDFKREIMAGITTFLTMAYIIAVNLFSCGFIYNFNGCFR